MCATPEPSPEDLARVHRVMRLVSDLVFGAIALVLVLAGTIVWAITGKRDWLLGGFFYAVFPIIGLFWTHFVLLRPGRDPVKTQMRLTKEYEKQKGNARTVARWNGLILTLAAPVLFLVMLARGDLFGALLAGAIFFVPGVLAMWWGWRKR